MGSKKRERAIQKERQRYRKRGREREKDAERQGEREKDTESEGERGVSREYSSRKERPVRAATKLGAAKRLNPRDSAQIKMFTNLDAPSRKRMCGSRMQISAKTTRLF